MELRSRAAPIARVMSGSLKRQRDTAGVLADTMGYDITIDKRWNEYDADDILWHHSTRPPQSDHGAARAAALDTSRTFQEVLDRALRAWVAAGIAGPTRETWPAFAARCTDALTEFGASLRAGETGIAVTSGGVIATISVSLLGLAPESLTAFNRVGVNCGLTKVVNGRRGDTLISFNEHTYLERGGSSLVTYR